jgi:pSer/pThr/pTyr-binding forkhead associated (FHA) protein
MSDRAFALRFISGKYQGGEYPLAAAGELVIGRSSELDMVLFEDMVSRKHAKLTLTPDQITIADLGSTNGTFVNGEKVRRAQLKEGDRILIGTSILKLVASPAGSHRGLQAASKSGAPRPRRRRQVRAAPCRAG